MNGFSEFKNITVNDSIRNVDFINTIFNETSDYSKLIDGSGYQTDGFTKTYIDGVLLKDTLSLKLDKGTYTGTAQDLKNAIDSKANTSHTHDVSNITNLQTSLDNKLEKGTYTGNASDLKSLIDTKISGSLTTNYITRASSTGTIVNSQVQDDGNGIGIGASPSTGVSLYLAKTIGGSTTGRAILATNSISPDVTFQFVYFQSNALTQAGSFTLGSLTHFQASQSTLGAGSSVTTQEGFRVRDNLIGATNNYGFRGQIPVGTNRWNLYMDGTANNYLAGNLAIGTISPNSTDRLHIVSSTTKSSLRLQSTEGTSSSEINLQTVGGSGKFELDYAGNVIFRTSQSGLFFDNFSATGSINFRTNGTNNRMTIDKDGNIGIGTTTPLRLLHIAGIARASTFTADRFAQDGLQGASYFSPGSTSTLSSQNNLTIQTVNSNTDVIITPTRNVGIGTTSPTEKLDVNGNVLVQGLLKLKPQTSAPTGVEGAIYYDSTTKKHYGFDGTTWNALY